MSDLSAEFDAQGRLHLAGELTIYQAQEALTILQGAWRGCAALEVDLGRVTALDTAGLQLLLMLKRAAPRNTPVQLLNHSEAVLEVLSLLNVSGELGDPVVIPSRGRAA